MDSITLDREAFKALASDTRLDILKSLDERRKTVTELGRELDLNKATVFEHLEKLSAVGLVQKIEDDRKWVYYELTWKGRRILHPEKITIALLLSSAGASLVTALAAVWMYVTRKVADTGGVAEGDFGAMRDDATPSMKSPASELAPSLASDPTVLGVALALALLCVTLATIAFLVWRRARRPAAAAAA